MGCKLLAGLLLAVCIVPAHGPTLHWQLVCEGSYTPPCGRANCEAVYTICLDYVWTTDERASLDYMED